MSAFFNRPVSAPGSVSTFAGLFVRGALLALLVGTTSLSLTDNASAKPRTSADCRNKGYDADSIIEACNLLLRKKTWDNFNHLHFRSKAWTYKRECERALADQNESLRLFVHDPIVLRKNLSAKNREFFMMHGFLNKIDIYLDCFLDYDKALAAIDEALALYPDRTDLFNRRALVHIHTRNFKSAFQDFQKAIDLADKRDVAFNNRASVFNNIGDYDSAIRDANSAIALNSRNPASYVNRAVSLGAKGDYERAIEEVNKAIQLDPQASAGPLAARGRYHLRKGDLEAALADLTKSIELFEKNKVEPILALCTRGELFRFQGNFSRALDDFDRAIRRYPDFAAAHTGRGLTHERMGDLAGARRDFQKAIELPAHQYDSNLEAQTTARARLAALDSGEAPPVIPIAAGKPVSPFSVATPPIAAVATQTQPPSRVQASAIRQGRRVALVIGNAAYQRAGVLKNPLNDSEAVAAAFRSIGFDTVSVVTDTTRERLAAALQKFARESDQADWAVVYYSGHGIEMAGKNYLLPVDVTLKTDRDVQFEAVPVDQVMSSIDGAKKLKLVVLDACRNNPFAQTIQRTGAREATSLVPDDIGEIGTRAVGRGLGEIKVAGASLVVFAAKHGQTALDGEGRNSPFAIALVQRMATPGVELNKVFRLVRDDVLESTAGRQEPYTYGSLPGREDFYFVMN